MQQRTCHSRESGNPSPGLDSRIRGNDRNIFSFALRAIIRPFVIPANAGIHWFYRIGKIFRPTKVGRYALFFLLLAGCQYTIEGNPDVNLTEVHLSPVSAAVAAGGHLSLSATVLGFSHTGTVTWSVVGTNNGTIVSNGLTAVYTAPPPPTPPGQVVNIQVTSDEDANRSVICPVTIFSQVDPVFTVDPRSAALLTNATQQFSIDSITALAAVQWEITSGPGTISNTGLYTPPATIDSDGVEATIRAVSLADNTVFSESTITLRNASDSLLCFTRDILPTLSASCGASGCHDASGRAGLNALTYSGVVNHENILPGNARASRLFHAIIQLDANSRMPPAPQPALPQNQVLKIGEWINEGAQNCQ